MRILTYVTSPPPSPSLYPPPSPPARHHHHHHHHGTKLFYKFSETFKFSLAKEVIRRESETGIETAIGNKNKEAVSGNEGPGYFKPE